MSVYNRIECFITALYGDQQHLASMDTTQQNHTDIKSTHWVQRTPDWMRPYLLLARIDRPIGIYVSLFPALWTLTLNAWQESWSGWYLALYTILFTLGAVIIRGAGCTLNDILDRKIDAQVTRTKTRPLPSGQLNVFQAIIFLLILATCGLVLLLQFNPVTIFMGCLGVILISIYPLMKRITWWPQVFLGFTINWGALIGATAVTGTLPWSSFLLYIAAIFWTIGYDTIYAHQDIKDDTKIDVKSTARKFGSSSANIIRILYTIFFILLSFAFVIAGANLWPLLIIGLWITVLLWQWRPEDPKNCLDTFKANRWIGAFIWAALLSNML